MSPDVLVLSGVLRGGGNTAALLNMLIAGRTDILKIEKSGGKISPCVNCGSCKQDNLCAVSDGMEQIYRAAGSSGKVIIASPIYFGNLTGFLLDIMSRFQRYFKDGYGGLPRVGPKKEGAIILTAGGYGETAHAEKTARIFMKMLNVENPVLITSDQTDALSASDDKIALGKIAELRRGWWGE